MAWADFEDAASRRHDLPAAALEHAILLEKDHCGPAPWVEIVVDRQEAVRRVLHALSPTLLALA
jgi:hypothetical protein